LNIIQAIRDENLFRPFFGEDLTTWKPWLVALRVLHGLPVKSKFGRRLIRKCTGRDPDKLPKKGFDTALFLTGRRSGKSRIAAVIGAHSAALSGLHARLAKGEKGIVPVVCPTKRQGVVVRDYLRGIFDSPMLRAEIVSERTADAFELRNGTRIEILPGDFRHVRGYTLLTVVVDEICFLGLEEDSKVRSDTELIRALQPALATCNGKLIGISSPYARKGWSWKAYRENFGNDKGSILVWNAPSRTMNKTLPQRVVDAALAQDYAAARAEYLGEFRDDVGIFLPREVIENLVVDQRVENLPHRNLKYCAFADLSGGRNDAAALAIAHRAGRKVILDFIRGWHAPHNPHEVIAEMSRILDRWKVRRVVGDNYAADFAASSFEAHGIKYRKCDKNKSQLYAELLPIICAGEIELLHDKASINQLANLERRTRSGGKDIIDHPPGGHDDLANAIAGVAVMSSKALKVVGAGGF